MVPLRPAIPGSLPIRHQCHFSVVIYAIPMGDLMPNPLPDPNNSQQWWGYGVGLGGLIMAIWGRLKVRPGLSESHVRRIVHEMQSEQTQALRLVIREEIAEEFRWRSYGQRLSQLERDKGEPR